MKAKTSAVLLSGLLLLMLGVAWAQSSDKVPPTCPPLSDEFLQSILQPTAWARADWNANTSRWEIDCKQLDSIANMPAAYPANAIYNSTRSPANALPTRRRSRGNSNYVNNNPYRSEYNNVDEAANASANSNAIVNVAANAAAPRGPSRRRPD